MEGAAALGRALAAALDGVADFPHCRVEIIRLGEGIQAGQPGGGVDLAHIAGRQDHGNVRAQAERDSIGLLYCGRLILDHFCIIATISRTGV